MTIVFGVVVLFFGAHRLVDSTAVTRSSVTTRSSTIRVMRSSQHHLTSKAFRSVVVILLLLRTSGFGFFSSSPLTDDDCLWFQNTISSGSNAECPELGPGVLCGNWTLHWSSEVRIPYYVTGIFLDDPGTNVNVESFANKTIFLGGCVVHVADRGFFDVVERKFLTKWDIIASEGSCANVHGDVFDRGSLNSGFDGCSLQDASCLVFGYICGTGFSIN